MTDRPPAEHLDASRYLRYHSHIYLPAHILQGALAFLPDTGVELRLSRHYRQVMDARGLPDRVVMPEDYEIIDVTVVRNTWAVFRVCIRFEWPGRTFDFVAVVQGDYEIVSAYWNAKDDRHRWLDDEGYEQSPRGEGGGQDVSE